MLWPFDSLVSSSGSVTDYLEREGWAFFAQYSPYSPLNLGSLRQPRPLGSWSEIESSFTFQDAFEDLLAVSAGKPMMSLDSRRDTSRIMRQVFPNGEPPGFWIKRLQTQGLLQTFARPQTSLLQPVKGYSWWTVMEDGRFSRLPEEHKGAAVAAANKSGMLPTEHGWGSVFEAVDRAMEASLPESISRVWRTWIGDLDKRIDSEMERGWDLVWDLKAHRQPARRWTGSGGPDNNNNNNNNNNNTTSHGQKATPDEPRGFEEATAAAAATAAATGPRTADVDDTKATWGDGTLGSLMEEVQRQMDHAAKMARATPRDVTTKTTTTTTTAATTTMEEAKKPAEGSVITTVREYVDEHGKLHFKTETRRLDRNGNQISRETEHRTTDVREVDDVTTGPSPTSDGAKTPFPVTAKSEKRQTGDDNKKRGWFWS